MMAKDEVILEHQRKNVLISMVTDAKLMSDIAAGMLTKDQLISVLETKGNVAAAKQADADVKSLMAETETQAKKQAKK